MGCIVWPQENELLGHTNLNIAVTHLGLCTVEGN